MALAFIYLALVLLGLGFVIFRNDSSLLKGGAFLKFNLIFLLISILLLLIRKKIAEDVIMVGLAIFVTFVSFLSRHRWLLFKYRPVNTSIIIEDSLSRVLIPFQKTDNSYILKLTAGENTYLRLIIYWPSCVIMVFRGDRHLKKVEVFQNLLKKNFSGVFPRLVIKLK